MTNDLTSPTDRNVATVDLTNQLPQQEASAWDKPFSNGAGFARVAAYAITQSDDPNEYDALFTEIKEQAETVPASEVVHSVATKVKSDQKAILQEALDKYARAGDVATSAGLLKGLADMEKEAPKKAHDDARHITQAAVERLVASNERVLKNNSPDKINRAIDTASEGYSWNLFLDHLAESNRPTGADWAKSIGRDVLPFVYQYSAYSRIPSLYQSFTGNDSTLFGKDILEDIQNKLSVMSLNDRKAFVSGLVKNIKDSNFVTNVDVSQFVSNLISGLSYEKANLQEDLDLAFTALDATVLSAPLKWVRSRTLAKTLAETGNKSLVGDSVARALADGVETQVAKELGISVDEAKNMGFSFNPNQFVPHAIEGAAPDVQKRLLAQTEELLTKLSDTLRTSGKTQPEIEEAIARIKKQYDPSVNPRIVSVDFSAPREEGMQSVVVWQGRHGKPFATMEEAQAWIERNGLTNTEIIPATSQPSALVPAKEVETVKASILGGIVDAIKKKAPVQDPFIRRLRDEVSVPLQEVGEEGYVMFKLATDPLLIDEGLEAMRRSMADAVIRGDTAALAETEQASQLMEELANAMESLRGAFSGNKPINYLIDDLAVNRPDLQDLFTRLHSNKFVEEVLYRPNFKRITGNKIAQVKTQSFVHDVLPDLAEVPGVSGSRFSTTLPTEMRTLFGDLVRELGMENQRIFVVTEEDVAKIAQPRGAVAKTLVSVAADKGSNAAWFVDKGNQFIVVKKKNLGHTYSMAEVAEHLAHELGHAFHYTWAEKYNKQIAEAYANWLYKRNILSRQDIDNLVLDDFQSFIRDFRSIYSGERDIWISKKLGTQTMSERGPSGWFQMYSEFFAEQFARWAYTDAVPVSIMERAWKELVDAIRKTLAILVRDGRTKFRAERTIDKMLQDHVKQLREGKMLPARQTVGVSPAATIDNERVFEEIIPGKVFEEDISGAIDINRYFSSAAASEELSTGWYVRQKRTDPLSLDVVGKFSETDINSMHTFLGYVDPKHGTSELLVEQRVIGVHAEAKMRRALTDFIKEPYDKLTGAERQQVLGVLTKGDAASNAGGVGKEYNYSELLSEGLNSNQIEAYFATRTARNVMHQMRDQAMVRSLRSKGYKRVEIGFEDGTTFTSAGKSVPFSEVKGKAAYDAYEGTRVYLTPKTIEDYEKSGFYVVETMEIHKPKGGQEFTRFVVRPSKTRQTEIQTVLPYRPGEFARLYTDEYFIGRNIRKSVNDEDNKFNEHMHTARTAKDAKAYVEGMNYVLRTYGKNEIPVDINELSRRIGQWEDVDAVKRDIENGLWKNIDDFNWHFNRMSDDYIRDYTDAEASAGRLFMDKRGQKLTPIDDWDRENTQSVMDSLSAEVTNSARVVSLTEWKDAAIRRWHNTFRDILPREQRYMKPEAAFFAMEGKTYVGTNKQNLFAERAYNYVMQQLGAKTKEDRLFEGMSRAVTERLFTGKLETIGAKLRQSEPITFLRTINFHAMLGMFNPAQLFVQANGAATAVILHPVSGLKAAYTAPLLRIALMSDNPEVWRKLANTEKLVTLGMSNVQEFEDTVRAIRRSGILDGINSTSLYNVEDGRFNIFSPTARKVSEGSAFFFNRGEEFTRLVSFDVARREWIKAHPKADWTTTEALREIVVRQDDLSQNMTRANQAVFQRGILSVPFQFLQYNIKLGANLFGAIGSKASGKPYRGFTATEAATLMLGHLALYGLANNGLGSMAEEILGNATMDMDEDTRLFFTQGVVAGVINETGKALTGEQVQLAVGKRLATFDWYGKVAKAIVDNDARTMETLMGPSASILNSIGTVGDVMKVWWVNPDLSTEDVIDGVRRIGVESITTLRNVDKAYIAYNHGSKIQTRAGADTARVNQYELFAQAIGMPSAEVADLEKVLQNKKDHFETLKRLSKLINEQQVAYVTALNTGDSRRAESILKTIQALYPTNSGDLDFVLKETRDSVYPFDTRLEKEIAKYLQTKEFGVKQPLITNRDLERNKINGTR